VFHFQVLCSMPKPKKSFKDQPAEVRFRERRLSDVKLVLEHPHHERFHQDTLPLPFGGQVKKDDMRAKGLMG